jgi:hypothetical protein
MKVRGEVMLQLQFMDRLFTYHAVVVVDGLHTPCIVGADFMEKHGICIDVKQRKLTFSETDLAVDSEKRRLDRRAYLMAKRECTIDAYQEKVIKVACEGINPGEDMVVADAINSLRIGDCLVRAMDHMKIKVMNLSSQSIVVRRGQVVGQGERVKCADIFKVDEIMRKQPDLDKRKGKAVHGVTSGKKPQLPDKEVVQQTIRIPREQQRDFQTLLRNNSDVFSINPNEVGKCGVFKQDIQLIDPNKVSCTPPYRMAHNLLPVAQEYVKKLLEADIIRASTSPFSSPLMLVKKPGQTDAARPLSERYRVVHDYRRLNANTKKFSYPMRNLYELIDEVSQGQVISIIDLSQGYWNQELEENAKEKTAFGMPGMGHFEYNRSAQGLCNSPSAFQRLLDHVTAGLKGVYVYIDDVVVVSKDYESHKLQLDQLFQRFREYGLKCRLSKLQLAAEEVNYLGYNISRQNGIRAGELKTQAIKKWEAPTDITQIKQFLGLCSFFRRTIQDFAKLSSPLTRLTRKDSVWKRGVLPEAAMTAFCTLKDKLVKRPSLRAVDFDKEFFLTVDSSKMGVGGILSQRHNGIEHPCAYASRTLSETEKKYSASHLEAFGILWCCRHFKPYLVAKEFTIRTDHKPLLCLNTNKNALDQIQAQLDEFLPYKLEYLQGDKMPADGLSRMNRTCNLIGAAVETTDQTEEEEFRKCKVSIDQMFDLQCQDKYIKALVCFLRYKKMPSSTKLRRYVTLLKPVAIFRRGIVGIMKENRFLALTPYHMRPLLLQLAHDAKLAGHFGSFKTLWNLQQAWYWPGMHEEVKSYCQSCQMCLTVNPSPNIKPAPMDKMDVVSRFGARVHIDLLGPLPTSVSGNKYALVMNDAFSSMVEIIAIPDKTAPVVAQAFVNGWISRHGVCDRINSDLGSEFTADVFKTICLRLGINHHFSSVMHPTSNGQVERTNRTLLAYIRKFITANTEWEDLLPTLRFAINSAPHETKRYTPFQIAFGRRPRLPSSAMNPAQTYSEDTTDKHLAMMSRIIDDVMHFQQQAFTQQKEQYDKRSSLRCFQPGDVVYLRRQKSGPLAQKFQPTFDGPWIVETTHENNIYGLRHHILGKKKKVHINILKPGKFREQMHDIPPGPSGNGQARRNSSGLQRVLRSLARQEDTQEFPMSPAPGVAPAAQLAPAQVQGPVAQDNIPEIPLVPIPDISDEEEDVEPEDEELDPDEENEAETNDKVEEEVQEELPPTPIPPQAGTVDPPKTRARTRATGEQLPAAHRVPLPGRQTRGMVFPTRGRTKKK